MENLLKLLPNIINDEDGLNGIVDNPDSLTLQFMETDITQDIVAYSQKLGRDNAELQELISNVKFNSNIEDLVSVLKSNGTTKWSQVADFIENMQKIEGIDLEGKSIPSVLWASTMFGFITEKERAHAGTGRFVDPLEVLTIQYLKSLSVSSDTPKVSINKLRAETVSIFENTNLNLKVKEYVARAILKNADWKETVNLDEWYDLATLHPIPVETGDDTIENTQELITALESGKIENYQKAINYIKATYLQNENNSSVKTLQSSLIVGLLAANLIEANTIENSDQLSNISFNIYLKLLGSQAVLEDTLKNYNQLITLSKGYNSTLQEPLTKASLIAMNILKDLANEDSSLDEIPVFVEETVEEISEEKTSKIQVGDRKAYVNGYLTLFSTLVASQIESYKATLDILSKIKSYKGEEVVNAIAEEFKVTDTLKTEEEIASKNQRTLTNAQITAKAVKEQLKSLNLITSIYNKVKNKYKDNLDIQDLVFDKQLLRKDFHITEPQHEEIIKEYYNFIAGDPILKNDQPQYRILSSKPMKLAELKERSIQDPDKYPNIAGMLRLVSPTKKIEAERTVYKLYADSEGNTDERYESLYDAISRKGVSLRDKKLSLDEAVKAGDITPKQQEIINAYIMELESKSAKKDIQVEGQISMDININTNENSSENESESENE